MNSHSGPGAFGFHHHARCVAVFGPAIAASEEAVALDPDIPLAQHFHPAGRCVHMYSLPGAVYKPVIPHHGVPGLHQQRPTADILRRVILKHQPSGLGAVGQQIPDSLRHEISRQLQLRLPGDPVPEHLQDSTGSIGQQGVRPDQLELVPRIGQIHLEILRRHVERNDHSAAFDPPHRQVKTVDVRGIVPHPAEHTPGNPDLPAAADEMSGVAVSGHHPAAGWLDPQALDPHIAAAVSDEPHPRPA